MDLSPEKVRAHFHKLIGEREKIDAVLMPLRNELDDLVAGNTDLSVKAAKERETVIRSEIRALQTTLAPIEMERAVCARALGGKTGA